METPGAESSRAHWDAEDYTFNPLTLQAMRTSPRSLSAAGERQGCWTGEAHDGVCLKLETCLLLAGLQALQLAMWSRHVLRCLVRGYMRQSWRQTPQTAANCQLPLVFCRCMPTTAASQMAQARASPRACREAHLCARWVEGHGARVRKCESACERLSSCGPPTRAAVHQVACRSPFVVCLQVEGCGRDLSQVQ
jgi:hypothetical protein